MDVGQRLKMELDLCFHRLGHHSHLLFQKEIVLTAQENYRIIGDVPQRDTLDFYIVDNERDAIIWNVFSR